MSYIAVAGGVNVDIGAFPSQKLKTKDSNPGHVKTSLGGVGRNIAHDLRLTVTPARWRSPARSWASG